MNSWKIRKIVSKEKKCEPQISKTAFINNKAEIKGKVYIGDNCSIGKSKIISETNHNIYIGRNSVVKEYVLICSKDNTSIFKNTQINNIKDIYIGDKVFISSEVIIHGPTLISNGVYIGNNSAIMNSKIGENCVIQDKVIICNVDIPPETCIPSKSVIDSIEKLNFVIAEIKHLPNLKLSMA